MGWREDPSMTCSLQQPKPALIILPEEKLALAAAAARGESCFSAISNNSWDTEKGVLGREMCYYEEMDTAAASSPRQMTDARDFANSRCSVATSRRETTRVYDEEDHYEPSEESRLENQSMKLLLYFSAPVVGVSLFCATWTIVSILVITFTYPVRRLVQRDTTLFGVLNKQSTSTMNIQLSCIYSAKLNDLDLSLPSSWLIHLISPAIALALMLWSWVAAFYWAGSAMVGNPDGLDGRNDGRELILSTRRWWRSYLLMGLAH